MSQHLSKPTQTLKRDLPLLSKSYIARAAALVVVLDLRPLSFTDHKEGLVHFVEAVFNAGQSTPSDDNIDAGSLLPTTRTVSTALTNLVNAERTKFKKLLADLIRIGGGVTTDGVTIKVQDKQFYDLTLHYITFTSVTPFDPTPKFSMCCRTLLLQEKKGNGNAETLRALLGNELKARYGCDIDELRKGFTMVTDNASVMARVANSSVSARVAPSNEKWLGCLVHQLNTAMKSCVAELANQEELLPIFTDVNAIKKIVRIFKQSNWNNLLPEGHKLIQEVETRFSTTFLVVKRFLKSAEHVEKIIQSKESAAAKGAYQSLTKSFSPSGESCFPALEAVVDAFQDVIDLQTEWEASTQPTIHSALPKLQICTDKLQGIVDGGSIWRGTKNGFIPAPRLSRQMCRATVEWLEAKVRVHPLLMAACYLNPLFREFQFIPDINKRRTYRSGGESMVRSLMAQLDDSTKSNCADDDDAQQACPLGETVTSDPPSVVGRKRLYSLLEYADTHFVSTTCNDEVSRYNAMDISQLPIDKAKYMKDPFSAVRFWHMHRSTFPNLFEVSLRIYAVPVSSCASERVFSAVNRIVSRDRASMKSETLEEIIVARSLLSEN